MKALVIHPEDRSTDFLKPIYANLKNKIVIHTSKDFEKLESISELKEHGWTDFFGKNHDEEDEMKDADNEGPYLHPSGGTTYRDAYKGSPNPNKKQGPLPVIKGGQTTPEMIRQAQERMKEKKGVTTPSSVSRYDPDDENFDGDSIADLEAWFQSVRPNPYKSKPWKQTPSYGTHKGYSYQKYVPPKDLSQMVPFKNEFDRFLMMGHGSPWGLFSMSNPGMVVNDKTIRLLKPCSQNVYIWCNADQYVKSSNLRGFFTGMFISEVGEAKMMNVKDVTQKMVNISNNAFARIVGRHINESVQSMHKNVKNEYEYFLEGNPVAQYNWDRLYVR